MADFERPIRTELDDGTPILIRQIRPEDKHYLEEGLKELSLASQHYRFFTAKKALSTDELKAFTEIDHHTHDAWGAFDESEKEPIPIGIARYVREPGNATTADFALTVIDHAQGKGLGTLLLGIIASRGVDHGITCFHSVELADNKKLFDLLNDFDVEFDNHGSETDVRITLCQDPDDYPKTPGGDVFRRAHALYQEACKG